MRLARRVNVGYISGILCLVGSLFDHLHPRAPIVCSSSPPRRLLPISTSPLSPSVPPSTQLSVQSQRARDGARRRAGGASSSSSAPYSTSPTSSSPPRPRPRSPGLTAGRPRLNDAHPDSSAGLHDAKSPSGSSPFHAQLRYRAHASRWGRHA